LPSIIVPARNNPEFTSMCLSTILFAVSRLKLSCEFILVDDASAPQERILDVFRNHRVNATGHETKIIRSRKHQHYSGVFSIGLHHATRDLIFFISNDMLVTPTFIEGLMLVSSLSRDIGIVRGTSNYTDSHIEHKVEPQQPLKTYQDIEAFSRNIFAANGCRWVEDQLLSGDAILLKRSLVDRIGVLDLRFFGYFGDMDYGARAMMAGFKLVCAKGAWLFHEGSGHVKHEMQQDAAITFDVARDRRMALVEAGYGEFLRKWQVEAPEMWSAGTAVDPVPFLTQVWANKPGLDLRYDFPLSVLDDLEIH
jgi:GT2 family glycosyltransferase